MKNSILSLVLIFAGGITTTAVAQQLIQGAAIEFEQEVHDYGNIPQGANGTYSFVFTNTGTEPLLISNAKGSCGCTVPTWPQEPIAPGASAKLDVTYDTQRIGAISKTVTINSNAVNEPIKVIRIAGNVLAPDSEGAQLEVVEEVIAAEVQPVEIIEVVEVPLTKEQIKAAEKAEKAAAKAEKAATKAAAKEAKKAAKS